MASFYHQYLVPQLSARLLSVCHIFRNHPTSIVKLYSQNQKFLYAIDIKKYCTLPTSIEQPCLASHCLLPFHSRTLCYRNVDSLCKYLPWSHNIIERSISSKNVSNCSPAQINDCSNSDSRFRQSLSSKNSVSIEDDEQMFFDKFMQYNKNDEDSIKTNSPIPLKKYHFCPTNTLTGRTQEKIRDYLKLHSISLNKADIPPPIAEFCDVEFPAAIKSLLERHYSAPTAIQAMGWSLALSGRDVVGVGQTGSGKTLAYVLPALLHTAHQQRVLSEADPSFTCHSPVAVVLAPSRELATQVARVANEYGQAMGVQVLLATGGVQKKLHLNVIQSCHPKFVVATPGRLLDLLRSEELLLNYCSFLVLDEADRMLDMGFEAQIRSIVQLARSDRQTLLWSATWPEGVQRLAASIVQEGAVHLTVGSTELRANPDVEQHVHMCEFLQKTHLLKKLLREVLERDPDNKILVFVQSKREISKLWHKLQHSGFSCDSLHADLDQPMRDRVLANFRKGRFSTLIATDLAARGLDIKGLGCVINYNFPHHLETYIHRIGRTGRCGQRGVAHTFFSQRDISHAFGFVRLLREAGQKVDSKLLYMAAKSRFLKESEKEIFLPFVPEKTSLGHKRSQSILGGRSGKLLGPVDPETVTLRDYAMNQAQLVQRARLQAKLDKRDKSKVVNTKYVFQKKR